MTAIIDIHARQILDSRGNPTVEVDVAARGRQHRPRGGAVGRLDRRARGGRAARRRQEPLSGQGRAARRSTRSTARSPTRSSGCDAEDQGEIDAALIELDGTAEQGAARRQRDPRRQPRRRQGGGRCARPAALPLCRRRLGARPAGADDEHHQRRRACRQSDRLPGIHGHAGRRADASPRRCAAARRSSTR